VDHSDNLDCCYGTEFGLSNWVAFILRSATLRENPFGVGQIPNWHLLGSSCATSAPLHLVGRRIVYLMTKVVNRRASAILAQSTSNFWLSPSRCRRALRMG
jgi:hypothetical protein